MYVFFLKSTISKVVIISIVGVFFLYKIAFLTTIEIIIISVVGVISIVVSTGAYF